MAWVYMLGCGDGSFYVGSTRSLKLRVKQHQTSRTRRHIHSAPPSRALVWAQEFENIGEAFEAEKRIQRSHAKRQALVEGRYSDLPVLSQSSYRRGEVAVG